MLAINPCLSVVGIRQTSFVYVDDVVAENVKVIYQEWYVSANVEERDAVSVLNDMIDVRGELGCCATLNTEDVNFIINDICTDQLPLYVLPYFL